MTPRYSAPHLEKMTVDEINESSLQAKPNNQNGTAIDIADLRETVAEKLRIKVDIASTAATYAGSESSEVVNALTSILRLNDDIVGAELQPMVAPPPPRARREHTTDTTQL